MFNKTGISMYQAINARFFKTAIACATTAFVTTGCIDLTSDDDNKLGKFIDSPVSGLAYSSVDAEGSESYTGRTNIAGEFRYNTGDSIVFSVGDISMPATAAQSIVTPLNIADTDNPADTQVLNILRLLQTLDEDGDASNGISISQQAHEAAEGLELDLSSEDFATDSATLAYLQAALGTETTLIDSETALAHFTDTLNLSEESPSISFTEKSLNNQSFYLIDQEDILAERSTGELDSVSFSDTGVTLIADNSTTSASYEVSNGMLHLIGEDDSNTWISILDETDTHLVTCWADTPLGSLLCESEEDYIRMFSDSTSASYFLNPGYIEAEAEPETGAATSGEETDGDSSSSSDNSTGDAADSDSEETDSTSGTDSAEQDTSEQASEEESAGEEQAAEEETTQDAVEEEAVEEEVVVEEEAEEEVVEEEIVEEEVEEEVIVEEEVVEEEIVEEEADEPELGAATDGEANKFNPGHYTFINISRRYSKSERETRRIAFIEKYIDDPNLKGFIGTYDWRNLETSKGVYDFDNIREILEMLEGTGKHFGIYLKERTFNSSCTTPPVPDYLMSSEYGGYYKYGGYVCMVKLFREDVMDRHIALFQAIGKAFDDHPNFEIISTGESAIGATDGYTAQGWTDQLIRLFEESKEELSHTTVNMQLNFLGGGTSYMEQIVQAMAETGGGSMGLPDTVPCRRMDIPDSEVCGYRIEAYDLMRKYNGVIGIAPDVETWDLTYDQTPEVFDMAVDYLGANYILWQSEFSSRVDENSYVSGYLDNQVIPTISANGGRINDECPSSFEPCTSSD
ncbi:hypothetical protein Q4485_14435 [Granulosicoccaceae sp. 1_MG-2023]|nr:hypothetical protein [Granulosicoccaceae sp. 1_MG-2023]